MMMMMAEPATSRHCGQMKLQATVPCGAALCNVQAADYILPALTAHPTPSACQQPCQPACLDENDQCITVRSFVVTYNMLFISLVMFLRNFSSFLRFIDFYYL